MYQKFVLVSSQSTIQDFLSQGDTALLDEEMEKAVEYYSGGVRLLERDAKLYQSSSLTIIISLHTNFATALAALGQEDQALQEYEKALAAFKNGIDQITDVDDEKVEATKIAAQSAFFLGMMYHDANRPRDAVDAYTYSTKLDPMHWSSFANLGSVLYDNLKNYDGALAAYNNAYNILTSKEHEPTDFPPNPGPVLSQLQYRIGLCISSDFKRQCVLDDDPEQKPVDCKEMAAHAFSLAIEYDPEYAQAAKHMLATITADATMRRASNEYVKSLFDEYAHNFEHSLVNELKYDGFDRLRRAFDRSFNGTENVPIFDIVIDAGCGTGLVGEKFRNISGALIGVDLSEAILSKAVEARPDLYDEVIVADVAEVFRERKSIDLIIAGDSYIYFGDLDPLFGSMSDGLNEDGFVAFTLENVSLDDERMLAETKPDWRWQLTASGRFGHRKDYVIQIGAEHNFELVNYEPLDGFRYEHGVGVRGHIFVMQKRRITSDEL